jgi:DNA-binding NarL/FixJ family response regulator
MLIDADPVFRSGLRIWLESFSDLNVVAEAEDSTAALQILADTLAVDRPGIASTEPAGAGLDLVLLSVDLGGGNRNQIQGFDLCRRLKAQYPTLSILLLSPFAEPVMLAAAQRVGANGYCARGLEVNTLVAIIRQVANGQPYWMDINQEGIPDRVYDRPQPLPGVDRPTPLTPRSPLRRQITKLRRNLRRSGVQQIDAALADIAVQLRNLDLSDLDRVILAGQQRELRVARWIVTRLLATADEEGDRRGEDKRGEQRTEEGGQEFTSRNRESLSSVLRPVSAGTLPEQSSALVPQPSALPISTRELQSLLFDAISAKLQTGLTNGTETALETDILREDKKRELFYLVLRKLEDLLDELRYSQVDPDQIVAKRSLLLLDLWQAVVIDFFGKYSTITVNGFEVEVVDELLQDMVIVQTAILDRIPGVVDLLNHLLFQASLTVDSAAYPPGNPESLARAELLLENLMVQVSNGVMQPLLNRFANVETIKQSLYDRRLLSSREIERFRNDLSWRYRLEKYVREPTDIFESKYGLWVLSGRGIKKTSIYASRAQELQQLSGIPFMVTLALETRDAVSPRLRAIVSFVGNGLIYVLTEVVGRGIGLIGRGVIKGIGNVWQDSRFNRH